MRLLAAGALLSGLAFGACKNDSAPVSSDVQSTDVQGNADQPLPNTEASTAFRTPESTIKTAQDLLVKHSELRDLMAGLQEQVLKVPSEVKQNVTDYPQLEATLEGYTEKGDFRVDELHRVLDQTQKDLQAGKTTVKNNKEDSGRLGYAEVDQILLEHTRSVKEIEAEYVKLKAAVEKLAKAPNNGKGLRLFE